MQPSWHKSLIQFLKLNPISKKQKLERSQVLQARTLVIHSDWKFDNGKNIHVGDNFLANYNWTVLDVGKVTIGDNVWIGPNTDIYTVNHPVTAMGRRDYLAKVLPVTIGNDVWLCGKITVCPGVTIGNNVVVAAGSVVIHDIPDNVMVAGNPARMVKKVDFE